MTSIADLGTGVLKNPEAIAEYQLGYDTKKKGLWIRDGDKVRLLGKECFQQELRSVQFYMKPYSTATIDPNEFAKCPLIWAHSLQGSASSGGGPDGTQGYATCFTYNYMAEGYIFNSYISLKKDWYVYTLPTRENFFTFYWETKTIQSYHEYVVIHGLFLSQIQTEDFAKESEILALQQRISELEAKVGVI